MLRSRVQWSGFSGGPGLSVFHWNVAATQANVNAVVAATNDFADNARYPCPPVVHLQADTVVDEVDESSGILQDIWSASAGTGSLVGVGSADYSAPAGACISWKTGTVADGRIIRGRTFVVPLAGDAYQNDGTLQAAAMARLTSAALALTSATPEFCVWHRPVDGVGGVLGPVTAISIKDKSAVLRSRRD